MCSLAMNTPVTIKKKKIRNEENMGDTGYRPGTSAPEVKRLSRVLRGDLFPNENIYIT